MSRPVRSSLSKRILWMALGLFVLPAITIGIIFQTLMLSAVHENYGSIAMDSVSRVADQLEYRTHLYEMLVEGVAHNEALGQHLSAVSTNMTHAWETLREIEQSFSYVYGELPGVQAFRIYHQNTSLVEDGYVLWKPANRVLADTTDTLWYQQTIAESALTWYLYKNPLPSTEVFAVLSTRIGNSSRDVPGAVYLQLSMQRAFGDAIQGTPYAGSQYIVLDSGNLVILSSDASLTGLQGFATPFADYSNMEAVEGIHILQEAEAIVVHTTLSNGWRLLYRLPMPELQRDNQLITLFQVLSMCSFMVFGIISILMIIRGYTHRLRQLDERLRTMSHGELNVSLPVSGADELTSVETRFNRMVKRVNELMAEVESQKMKELKETIRTLESYVNPHFLYNTLGLIRWRALDDGDDELCALVDDMTTYYRLSLSGGKSVVLVEDEIAHLEAYIAIEQRRYGDTVNIIWAVDDDVRVAYTPKNILQTIVENSYVHGLIPEKPGNEIRISVKAEGNKMVFDLSDNGIGITPDTLSLLESDDPKVNHGIGIRSVRQRLRLFFGDQMKMQITSETGKGTRVRIEIPFCLETPTIMGGVKRV